MHRPTSAGMKSSPEPIHEDTDLSGLDSKGGPTEGFVGLDLEKSLKEVG